MSDLFQRYADVKFGLHMGQLFHRGSFSMGRLAGGLLPKGLPSLVYSCLLEAVVLLPGLHSGSEGDTGRACP